MPQQNKKAGTFSDPSQKTNQRLTHSIENIEQMSQQQLLELIAELQDRQAELEQQNETHRLTQQELEKLRDKYFELYEFAPVGYLSVDNKGLIKEANFTAAKLLNTERQFLINVAFSRFVAAEYREIFRFHLKDILTNRDVKTFEIIMLRKDGAEWYVQLECVAEYDDAKNRKGFRVAVVDIHERKLLEQELDKSELKFRHIVGNAPSGIYEVDFENMRFLSANEAARRITGHTEEEMIKMNPLDILTPESRQRFLKRLAKIKRGEEPPTAVEFEVYKKDGGTTWVLLNVQFHKQNGMIGKATVVVHDIQKRKEIEFKLRESERRFRTLAENAPDIIVRYDKELRHLYVSPAIEPIAGISHEEFVGKTNRDLGMPTHLCKKWDQFLNKIYKTGKPNRLEFDFTGPDETYSFEMRAMPEFTEMGEIESILCITRNITEQKRAIQERDRLFDELNVERARLEAIISYAPQGIVVTDDQARIIMTNAVANELYARPVPFDKPYNSHAALELFDEKGRSITPRELPLTRSALDGEIHLNKELMIKKPDGEQRYLLVNSSPIRGPKGTISGAVGVFQDITERKLVYEKQSLDKAQKYARNIVETVHNPILLLAPDLKVVLANRSFYWFFQVTSKETIGKYLYKLGNRQWDIPELRNLLEDILPKQTTVRDYVIDLHFEKIGRRILTLNAHKLRGTLKQEERILLSISDITEQKLAEQEQLEYQQKLRALSAQLTNSEEKERRRIAMGLHDSVVQSLTATRIKLALAQEDKASEASAKHLKEVDEVIELAIDEIRLLSFELSPPMLHTTGLEQTIEWFADQFKQKYGIPVFVKNDGLTKPLTEDIRNILFQAVRELLNNVVKHAQASQVTISIKKVDHNIQIELKDDGVGFDTTQLFSASGKTGGFGLFNIRERLEYENGSLSLESQIGKGTRIVLTAPLMKGGREA